MTQSQPPYGGEKGPVRGGAGSPGRADFVDLVMATLADEPLPSASHAFVAAVRSLSPRDAAAALWVAWHLGTAPRVRLGRWARIRSVALVLSVILIVTATGSLVAAAAVTVVGPIVAPIVGLDQPGPDEQGPTQNDQPRDSGVDQQGPTQADETDASDQPGGVDDGPGPAGQSGGEGQSNDSGVDQQGPTQADETDASDQPGGVDDGPGLGGQSGGEGRQGEERAEQQGSAAGTERDTTVRASGDEQGPTSAGQRDGGTQSEGGNEPGGGERSGAARSDDGGPSGGDGRQGPSQGGSGSDDPGSDEQGQDDP